MYIIYILDLAALLFLLGLLFGSSSLDKQRKMPFSISIILTVIVILSEVITVLSDSGNINLRSVNILFNVLGFALTPVIPIAIISIFGKGIFKKYKLLLIPTLINVFAAVLSPLFGFIFYVDAQNNYVRGNYFFIFIIVYLINLLLLVVRTLDWGRKYNYPIMWKMLGLSVFIMVGTSIQLVNPLLYVSWHCVTLALFLYFILISEFDSSIDSLTGLYNRASFDQVAKQMMKSKGFSVIVLDIDHFKSFNDKYGHDYGDRVIETVAAIIRKSFNKKFTCYRFGGDEFSIIGSETDQEKIEVQLKTMTDSLTEMREQGKLLPTISYGYSIFRGKEKSDFNKMLKEADEHMYEFKKIRKDQAAQASTDPLSNEIHSES